MSIVHIVCENYRNSHAGWSTAEHTHVRHADWRDAEYQQEREYLHGKVTYFTTRP